ncbi:L-2-hydroxyglutarate oxidase LhgO [Ensifer sp. M14]|uniref:NAD(P)/FAD-dependent oxidoreductase n=1 Tax=Sinorhizobium/Ensifer group TaxID=227292 RepID=UPI0009853FCC|nr:MULTISPECIES: NAD(P)/FAD-dependent oxidoreductase [Sinorhizobium/Ensifer group]OOG70863.1 FAD-dependent oxidoreductase [Sinorhizobium sp. A49]RDL48758.1 L-2-hydroxyglutarate oxidase LhgO [Ensifer sp. M14]
MPLAQVECIVAGAGVVGLAVARALAQAGREVILIEAADRIGSETSSRNSEVIHAGIYYPPDSLMARLCVEGRTLLYAYCRERGIPHRQCGKLIVATSATELEQLPAIAARAARNGVTDLSQISVADARILEPALATTGALLSPSTGIIDSHAYMLSLLGDAENAGAVLALNSPVERGRVTDNGIVLDVGGAEPVRLACRLFVNAAGLAAPKLARLIKGLPPALVPREYYAKGDYFSHVGKAPFSRLIYPVPVKGALGIHLTLDMAGQARFGPDIEWVDTLNYDVDPAKAASFYAGVRRYFPDLKDGALVPAYSGIRPKIVPPDVASQDFVVQGPGVHGVPGLINLFGIESPGLTASLALAKLVAET